MAKPLPLNFKPGVDRDGTMLDSDAALDALWTRWRLGRPRSMGGYEQITTELAGVPRKLHMLYQGHDTYVHVGTASGIQQVLLDRNGGVLRIADRTPLEFQAGPNVGWTLDAIFDTTSKAVQLIAHAVPDLSFLANDQQTVPFLGNITAVTKLGAFSDPGASDPNVTYTAPNVAGGVVSVQPFVFDFDINGFIGWSAPNLPNYLGVTGGTTGAGKARVSAQKIVAGMPLRGGGVNSPAALFWSLSEVISANFIGGTAVFAFNTVSPSSSILSQAAVIEYDGLYFWPGVDRFMVYNGTVVEVPNSQNLDWFFDNMNWDFAAKTFAFKVPRYGEIWFCAPLFGNTEPSHAAIYNLRENCWYDTALPNGGRSAAYFAQGFRFPVMAGPKKYDVGYALWMHEKGTDEVILGQSPQPVRKYYQTPWFSGPKLQNPTNRGISLQQLEPDMAQTGDMTITPVKAWNARSGEFDDKPTPLPANPNVTQEQLASFRTEGRLMSLRMESNTLGGSFVTGKNIVQATDAGDERITGGMDNPRS